LARASVAGFSASAGRAWSGRSSSCTSTTEPQPDEQTCGLDTLQALAKDVGDWPARAVPVADGTDLYGLVQSGGVQWECL
jgi:hypothetical protein